MRIPVRRFLIRSPLFAEWACRVVVLRFLCFVRLVDFVFIIFSARVLCFCVLSLLYRLANICCTSFRCGPPSNTGRRQLIHDSWDHEQQRRCPSVVWWRRGWSSVSEASFSSSGGSGNNCWLRANRRRQTAAGNNSSQMACWSHPIYGWLVFLQRLIIRIFFWLWAHFGKNLV